MRKRLLGSVAALLTSAGLSFAEQPAPKAGELPPSPAVADEKAPPKDLAPPGDAKPTLSPAAPTLADHACAPKVDIGESCKCGPRFWGGGEYLLWWIQGDPINIPLVTTGDTTTFGALGAPNTQVLFGNEDINYGPASGVRATVGAWLDTNQRLGFEATGFLLEKVAGSFRANSDANGSPVLAIPLESLVDGAGSYIISTPDTGTIIFTGGVAVISSTRLWGAEANGLFAVRNTERLRLSLVGGFRYLDLADDLSVPTISTDIFPPPVFGTQIGIDQFQTRNQFYGGQLGVRASTQFGRLSAEARAQVALGANHQTMTIAGYTVSTDTALFAPVLPGSHFAGPTNIGRHSRDEFSVIPEVELRLGYDVSRSVHVYVGYNFLYMSNALRAGPQLDPVNANPNNNPFLPAAVASPTNRPAALFNQSDFFAHGLSFGLEFRY